MMFCGKHPPNRRFGNLSEIHKAAGGTRRHQRHAASRLTSSMATAGGLLRPRRRVFSLGALRPLTRLTTFLNSGTARPAACRIQAEPCLLVSLSPTVLAVTLLVHRASKQMAGRNGSQTQR
jgi:hypothetical protein